MPALERVSFLRITEMLYLFVFTQFPAKAFHALPGKTATHLLLELL
ncbi:hypothetical protein ACVIDN_004232 [Rhizobium brockwellii]